MPALPSYRAGTFREIRTKSVSICHGSKNETRQRGARHAGESVARNRDRTFDGTVERLRKMDARSCTCAASESGRNLPGRIPHKPLKFGDGEQRSARGARRSEHSALGQTINSDGADSKSVSGFFACKRQFRNASGVRDELRCLRHNGDFTRRHQSLYRENMAFDREIFQVPKVRKSPTLTS